MTGGKQCVGNGEIHAPARIRAENLRHLECNWTFWLFPLRIGKRRGRVSRASVKLARGAFRAGRFYW